MIIHKKNRHVSQIHLKQYIPYMLMMLGIMLLNIACNPWKDVQFPDSEIDKDLLQTLSEYDEISIFTQMINKTPYKELLKEDPSLTVFAPTNNLLESVDLSDTALMTQIVGNHIAKMLFYQNEDAYLTLNNHPVDFIEMINKKNIMVDYIKPERANIVCSNGVLYIVNDLIELRKSIYEYINDSEQFAYEQVQFIHSMRETIMDMEKSVQIGLDVYGQPLYDTVYAEINPFLDAYPLDNEREHFTLVLLDNDALELLKQKYAKYMHQQDESSMTKNIMFEISSDLVLNKTLLDTLGRYASFKNVLVNLNPDNIVEFYQASNGYVYKLSAADIKLYENKIKTQIVEAENFVDNWDNAWIVRHRSWASNGKDVVLKGRTRWEFTWDFLNPEDSVTTSKSSGGKTFLYTGAETVKSSTNNAYIAFNPTMYSCDYEFYWVSYDDVESHYYTNPDTEEKMPLVIEQKLLISFPGEPKLKRDADGKISNNFSAFSTMAASSVAGVHEEKQLVRYRLNPDNATTGSSVERLFLLSEVSDGVDVFGSGEILKCPSYGQATVFVANTVRSTNADAGLVFLDYIRLVPKVDIND